jgi:hypothetical protein
MYLSLPLPQKETQAESVQYSAGYGGGSVDSSGGERAVDGGASRRGKAKAKGKAKWSAKDDAARQARVRGRAVTAASSRARKQGGGNQGALSHVCEVVGCGRTFGTRLSLTRHVGHHTRKGQMVPTAPAALTAPTAPTLSVTAAAGVATAAAAEDARAPAAASSPAGAGAGAAAGAGAGLRVGEAAPSTDKTTRRYASTALAAL